MLASGLIASGFSPAQAVLIIFVGNLIVLIPILRIGSAGARYGVPFPVLLRTSFGPRGAQVAALARAFVACGWFGINTWVGAAAIYSVVNIVTGGVLNGPALPAIGINIGQCICLLLFWVAHIYFITRGPESIRWLETVAAPFLLVMGIALLGWAYVEAGGFGPLLSATSVFDVGSSKAHDFWPTMIASLTGMVGFWATLALNICDFTRFAKSQRDQIIGQVIGLPIPMALFSFIGVAVTSSTVVIFGRAIWNPTELAEHLGRAGSVIGLIVILTCTLTVNMAANVVSPSYDFSNLAPSKISFRIGGYITATLGLAIFPWKLISTAGTYIFVWLVGYSALLGPIAGIMICDYYIVRRQHLVLSAMFRHADIYGGDRGWNWNGFAALAAGIAPNLPGFLHSVHPVSSVPLIFDRIFQGAWFVGFAVGGASYVALCHLRRSVADNHVSNQ